MPIDEYLRDAARYSRISYQDTLELGRIIRSKKKGSTDARNKLVEGNLLLVPYFIFKYISNVDGNLQDLVQEGNLGLIEAANRFDPKREVQFSTFAAYCVRRRVIDYLQNNHGICRIPVDTVRAMGTVLSEIERHYVRYGVEPKYEELMKKLRHNKNSYVRSLSKERVIELINLRKRVNPLSLDKPILGQDNTLTSLIEDSQNSSDVIEENTRVSLMRESLEEALTCLKNPKHRDLIRLRFGLFDGIPRTFDEISRILGGSRQGWESQEKRALGRLRKYYFMKLNSKNGKK
ncbi:MAG TPA: sigma-70 family RNA polymerase sigma factor [Candidatus Nanoarchaeia archaeon]|nr:sigma-70 family RNA polymerase sigma factor [Candidatus Nanoarchaeia archaeon]